MINVKILKLASDTKYLGLTNKYTHKITAKNKTCGDRIKLEIIIKKDKISLIKYDTESCVYCQASASLLANYLKSSSVKSFKKNFKILNNSISENKVPKKFKFINILINNKNKNRYNCIMLPFTALSKALNV